MPPVTPLASAPVPEGASADTCPQRPAGPPDDALWARLAAHTFDDMRDPLPLSARLAQRTGWPAAQTQRVLEEYRRFLYLAMQCQGQVCPSEAVDEAWHTHLLDSARYFEHFCPHVLGVPLHHRPSRGGTAEGERHQSHYRATLAAYERLFGEAPPRDIWPAPGARFAERTRHVSSRTHWVLPKPRLSARAWRPVAFALTLPALLVASCVPVVVHPQWSGPQFLERYVLALAVLVGLGVWLILRGRDAPPSLARTPAGQPDAVALAYLAGGPARAVLTAVGQLAQDGHARQDTASGHWQTATPPDAHAPLLAHTLYQRLANTGSLQDWPNWLRMDLDSLHAGLAQRGFLSGATRSARARTLVDHAYNALWAGLLAWGALRVAHGFQAGRPVFALLALMLLSALIWYSFSRHLPPRLTRQGRQTLRTARETLFAGRRQRDRKMKLSARDPRLPLALALLGTAALAPELAAQLGALDGLHQRDTGGGGGCGGSLGCGSDGGSSSDGGCGGCGGGD